MRNPWFIESSIAASGSARSRGDIKLVKARTVGITVRETCGSSIDANTTVYVYYSPDGTNWDTEAYTSFEITYGAGETVQRTVILDIPEHGFLRVVITNGSSADTLSDVRCWYSVQSWEEATRADRGDIRRDTGED